MKACFAGCVLCLAVFLAALVACDPVFQETRYKEYEALRQLGIEEYWAPPIPVSATDIVVREIPDSNEVWVRFEFASEDLHSMIQACQRATPAHIVLPRSHTKSIPWWREDLTDEPLPTNLQYYQCSERLRSTFLAVDIQGATAFYWRGPS